MTNLLPIILLLGLGLLAWWLWWHRPLDDKLVRAIAAVAGAILLYDAITEPSRRYVGLLFVFLSVLAILRPEYLMRRRET